MYKNLIVKITKNPYMYGSFGLVTICSILLYIFAYLKDKDILIPEGIRQFIISTSLVAIVLIVFGIIIVFNLKKLREENSFLVDKMLGIQDIVKSLIDFIDINFASVENNVTEQLRELEDNLVKEIKKTK